MTRAKKDTHTREQRERMIRDLTKSIEMLDADIEKWSNSDSEFAPELVTGYKEQRSGLIAYRDQCKEILRRYHRATEKQIEVTA